MLTPGPARRARPLRHGDELTHADAALRDRRLAPERARPQPHVATQHAGPAGERLGWAGSAWAAADRCPPAAATPPRAFGQFVRRARVNPATLQAPLTACAEREDAPTLRGGDQGPHPWACSGSGRQGASAPM